MESKDVIGLVLEIVTWAGLGFCVVFAVAAGIARLVAGTWISARGLVIPLGDRTVVRWFRHVGDRTGEAELTAGQLEAVGERVEIDIFYDARRDGRIRLEPQRSAARPLSLIAAGFLGLGVAAAAAQLVMLALSG